MGAYLSKPNCEKQSEDCDGEFLRYGASSMQGWRISQEDAHCCIIDFDESNGTSFFGVYDGHGGAEVAQYTAEHLPNFLKSVKSYKENKLAAALEEAFLGFDATLVSEDIKQKLATLAGDDPEAAIDGDAQDDDEKREAAVLREEASMPINELLERFGGANAVVNRPITLIKQAAAKKNLSPILRAKPNLLPDGTGDNQEDPDSSEVDKNIRIKLADSLPNGCLQANLQENEAIVKKTEREVVCADSSSEHVKGSNSKSSQDSAEAKLTITSSSDTELASSQLSNSSEQACVTSESDDVKLKSNGAEKHSLTTSRAEVSSHSSSDAEPSTSSSTSVPASVNANQMTPCTSSSTSSDADAGCSSSSSNKVSKTSDSSDEDTPTSDDDDSEDEPWKEEDNEDDSDDDEPSEGLFGNIDDDDDDSSEEDSDAADECDDDEDMEGGMEFGDEPGADSGCTAVVALLHGNELYVANSGDSRCVLCRDGKAVEMSVDHKPEDEPEKDRIIKAGGRVTCDGRVNGGLNLSRAIGDHIYKRNKAVSDREQMITALPDVRSVTLDERDQFMVLACDGIWNVMSSQDVVDFVKRNLESGVTKLSAICEEMFDFCLAPDTTGDGTGCDNMTCAIVKFDGLTSSVCMRTGVKRKVSDLPSNVHENGDEEDMASKRPREDNV